MSKPSLGDSARGASEDVAKAEIIPNGKIRNGDAVSTLRNASPYDNRRMLLMQLMSMDSTQRHHLLGDIDYIATAMESFDRIISGRPLAEPLPKHELQAFLDEYTRVFIEGYGFPPSEPELPIRLDRSLIMAWNRLINPQFPGENYHYQYPRQTGVSFFLVALAFYITMRSHDFSTVTIVARNTNDKQYLKKKINDISGSFQFHLKDDSYCRPYIRLIIPTQFTEHFSNREVAGKNNISDELILIDNAVGDMKGRDRQALVNSGVRFMSFETVEGVNW